MPLDPSFRPLLDAIAARAAAADPAAAVDPIVAARAGIEASFTNANAPAVGSTDRTVPGPGGEVPVRIYTPAGAGPFPLLVFFHGGGWVGGSLNSHDGTARELCAAAEAVVVAVDYRLAPEHRFPAGLEDCYAALTWVAQHAAELNGDASRLAICGDSAGGNLSAAVALVNRDRGGPRLSLQVLVYPVIDPSCATESMRTNGRDYMLTSDSMQWMWSLYVGKEDDFTNPYAAPRFAHDLSGLPPALVITAEYDPLRDEGE